MKFKKGFTLIELLIVVAIIGILTSIVLASLSGARARGRDTKRAADLKQLQQAAENYFENYSTYPPDIGASLYPAYIASPANDPLGPGYAYTGTATTYCIGASFEQTPPTTLGPSSLCVINNPNNPYNFKVGNQ